MVATLLIFALITIGCVSAADDVQTDDAVAVDDDTIEEEILTDENNEPGTFSDLVAEISKLEDGDTLELTKDYTYNPDTDSAYSQYGFAIGKNNFTIDGKGHTLSKNNQAGGIIYDESRANNFTFKNIIIIVNVNTTIVIPF